MSAFHDQTRPSAAVIGFAVAVAAFLAAFLVYPFLHVIKAAFLVDGEFTLAHFRTVFLDNPVHRLSLTNSLLLALSTTALTSVVALPLAIIGVRYRFPGKRWVSALLLLPLIMPPFVGAVGIKRMLARGGSLNLILVEHLKVLDEGIDILGAGGFWAIAGLQVLHLFPIMYLNVAAALGNVDPSMEEAARNTGDHGLGLFRKITFPLMLPGYFAGAVLVFIWSFTDLGTPLIFGYRNVVPVRIFENLQQIDINPIAYALVVVVAVASCMAFVLGRRLVARSQGAMVLKGGSSATERPLPRWAWGPVWIALLLLSCCALLPHISVIITSVARQWSDTVLPTEYTLQHYVTILNHELTIRSVKNSLMLAAGSTFLDVLLGVGIAYIIVRKRFPGIEVLDTLAMLPLALPGIVIAFGYVTCYQNTFLDARRNPFPLLMIAYGVRRLPYMVRATAAGFQQASPTLEEAALNVGAPPGRALLRITIPLIMANILAGTVLAFSFAMLEVSDSLVLAYDRQHYPLTKAIYQLATFLSQGEYLGSALGVVAMGLLAVTLIITHVLLGKRMGVIFRV